MGFTAFLLRPATDFLRVLLLIFLCHWITLWSVWPNRMDFCVCGFVLLPERLYLIKTFMLQKTEGFTVLSKANNILFFTEMMTWNESFMLFSIGFFCVPFYLRWLNVLGIWIILLQLDSLLFSCLVFFLSPDNSWITQTAYLPLTPRYSSVNKLQQRKQPAALRRRSGQPKQDGSAGLEQVSVC